MKNLNQKILIGMDAEKIFITESSTQMLLKHFLAKNKIKKFKIPRNPAAKSNALEENPDMKDKIFSFEHVRNHHDAILFGARQRNAISCNSYHVEMRTFLDDYKKEVAYGNKNF